MWLREQIYTLTRLIQVDVHTATNTHEQIVVTHMHTQICENNHTEAVFGSFLTHTHPPAHAHTYIDTWHLRRGPSLCRVVPTCGSSYSKETLPGPLWAEQTAARPTHTHTHARTPILTLQPYSHTYAALSLPQEHSYTFSMQLPHCLSHTNIILT